MPYTGLLILIVVLLVIYLDIYVLGLKKECNLIDGRCYSIVKTFDADTYPEASKLLAHLNLFSIKLMRHLRNKYLWNNTGNELHRDVVGFLLHNYNPDNIIENNPPSDVNTSYVEDKGRIFAICLREKASGRNLFHDKHTLEYVMMHELAHLANHGIGHARKDFWPKFKFLLEEANNIGLHYPIDYAVTPVNYCSLFVNYNPYFDNNVQSMCVR